jgi:hypothetical protein
MGRVAFADESGTDGKTPCYAIGVVSVDENKLDGFNGLFHDLYRQHGLVGEAKWAKVNQGHGLINFALDWMHKILWSHTGLLDVIVVKAAEYQNWSRRDPDREGAFYKTYTQLLKHLVRRARETTQVFIDDRSDSYDKQHEAVEVIGNRMLAILETEGRIKSVTKARSREMPGIQVADLLTGAIQTAHRLYLDPQAQVNAGKRLAIRKMAALLGWDAMHYDTLSDSPVVNIWHFPTSYRAVPKTRRIEPMRSVPRVTPDELREFVEQFSSEPKRRP